jgi:uncharacterized membrane protein
MLEETLIRSIENQTWIDRAADPIQDVVRSAMKKAPGLASFLHGNWLGHPLHAALVALPVGAWSTGLMLDAIAAKNRKYRRAADTVTAIGLAGAGAAILPGLADWGHTEGGAKRVGFVHATLNTVIAGLYGGSVYARARGSRKAGVGLAIAGYTLAIASAWLGGELAYRFAVGVRPQPSGRVEAAPEEAERPHPAAESRP